MPDGKKILLDTNFLLIPGSLGVDIFRELENTCNFNYELYVLDKSLEELKKIVEQQTGKDKQAAQLALKLVQAKKIKILTIPSQDYVDDILVHLKDEYIIATQDKDLKRKLKNVLVLRQKKYIQLIEA
ncbi:hypothetical protein HYY69_00470 [Candidatus Woesearchaeota archaeon]|nr:hypothetical protein [Candidatus Woesearchaeota archaeon]